MKAVSSVAMKKEKRTQAAIFEGWLSITINLILFVIKYWAGIMSSSLALIVDGWHTLSDSITSVIVLISSRISSKPADKEHPYGHGRAELIASLLIGAFLAIISVEFIKRAIEQYNNQGSANYGSLAIVVVVVSILGKELLAQIANHLSKKYKLSSLNADAHHHRSDALSSLIVLIGILIGRKVWWMDSLLSLLVATLIGYTAYRVIFNAGDGLLGKKIDEKLRQDIENICTKMEKEINVKLYPHHYHLHSYGNHRELTFHLKVPIDWKIGYGHSIADKIEKRIREQLSIESTIHLEPR